MAAHSTQEVAIGLPLVIFLITFLRTYSAQMSGIDS